MKNIQTAAIRSSRRLDQRSNQVRNRRIGRIMLSQRREFGLIRRAFATKFMLEVNCAA